MVADKIRVFIVDDVDDTRSHLAKLLSFETDMEVVGDVPSGLEALSAVGALAPDVVLMDINMPGMDGIEAAEQLSKKFPMAAIVMMSVQGDADYLRRSMLAGARAFLVKPFTSDELMEAIRSVAARRIDRQPMLVPVGPGIDTESTPAPHHLGRVIALYSPKGGVGRTTLAVNLAIAATQLGKSAVVVDASLQFGDVGVLLNMSPKGGSVADIVGDVEQGAMEAIDGSLMRHSTGVSVLLSPASPETAELITAEHMRAILGRLRQTHDVVVVDCSPWLNDATLAVLDVSQTVVGVLTLDLTSIKSMRLFVSVADQLGYGEDKLRLALNRADSSHGIALEDVERSIGRRIDHMIVSDGRAVVHALNHGIPFVAGNRRAQISRDVVSLAGALLGDVAPEVTPRVTRAPARRLALARR